MSVSPDSSIQDLQYMLKPSIMTVTEAAKNTKYNKGYIKIQQSWQNFQKIKQAIENAVAIGDYEVEVSLNNELIDQHFSILEEAGYKIYKSVSTNRQGIYLPVKYQISWVNGYVNYNEKLV